MIYLYYLFIRQKKLTYFIRFSKIPPDLRSLIGVYILSGSDDSPLTGPESGMTIP